jgi:hopene-associated glycosyltransferase HpnB
MMITLIGLLSLAAWIYLIGFRGRFWQSGPVLDAWPASGNAKVAVVVPARDEAHSIRQSLESLLAQEYPGELSIILVDDNSTDETVKIATALAPPRNLTVLRGEPLPSGWSGKLWAVHQGLAHQSAKSADFILLTDADIAHAPTHITALVAKAEIDSLDLVSEMVHMNCVTGAERALIPAFVFFFEMLYPFAWVSDVKKGIAGAAGGTMLVRRSALDRVDGVSRIRHQLIDDCALAREIKCFGGRIWLGHANDTVSLRVYANWREVWDMIARTAYIQLRRSPLLLVGCIIAMSVIYCAPPLLTIFAQGMARIPGLLAWILMALAYQPTLRRYHRSPLWGLALPGIGLFYLCATIDSAIRHYSGRGGGWKNRVYPADPAA